MFRAIFWLGALLCNCAFAQNYTVYTDTIDRIRQALTHMNVNQADLPTFVRLSWHDAGTYHPNPPAGEPIGGAHGCMALQGSSENTAEANKGLQRAIYLLEDLTDHPVQQVYQQVKEHINRPDYWSLVAVLAIEVMGGPKIPWRYGRVQATNASTCAPSDSRLPSGDPFPQSENFEDHYGHVQSVFSRMGFSHEETVALIGAHTLGQMQPLNSGFEGPWTDSPNKFNNEFFTDMFGKNWTAHIVPNTQQREFIFDGDGQQPLAMLWTDLALINVEETTPTARLFADNETAFFEAFASAFQKLQENGYDNLQVPVEGAPPTPGPTTTGVVASASSLFSLFVFLFVGTFAMLV